MRMLMKKFFPSPGYVLERRLHKRAVEYWRNALGQRELLTLADFDPLRIEDDTSHGFMLDLRNLNEPMVSYIGPVLEQEAGVDGHQVRLADVPPASLLARFASHYVRVIESRQPETAEYDFVTFAGYHVLCRGAMLPLSSDGITVDHVYGVVSWKSEKVDSNSVPAGNR